VNATTNTTDSGRQLAELMLLFKEDHPYFLAVEFSDGEIEFLRDLADIRDRRGDLLRLTPNQAGWLQAIHRKAARQCRQADALAAAHTRGPIDMRRYHVGA